MLVFDTICALATPPYKAALATIRLSGEKTLDILSHIIVKDVSQIKPNMAYFVKLYQDKNHPDEMIDEVVLTFYKGPKSYTGFDTVEFSEIWKTPTSPHSSTISIGPKCSSKNEKLRRLSQKQAFQHLTRSSS